jgi:hypothetical protein
MVTFVTPDRSFWRGFTQIDNGKFLSQSVEFLDVGHIWKWSNGLKELN